MHHGALRSQWAHGPLDLDNRVQLALLTHDAPPAELTASSADQPQ